MAWPAKMLADGPACDVTSPDLLPLFSPECSMLEAWLLEWCRVLSR